MPKKIKIEFCVCTKLIINFAKNCESSVEIFGKGLEEFRWYTFDCEELCGEIITVEIESLFRSEECARKMLAIELGQLIFGHDYSGIINLIEFFPVKSLKEKKPLPVTERWVSLGRA